MIRSLLLVAAGVFAADVHALEPEVNLSGAFALSLSYFGSDLAGNDLDIDNNASNIRLTAAAQEVGIRAFMAYERAANNDGTTEAVREFFGGMTTAYGTLVYGRMATDYRKSGSRLDAFHNTSVLGFDGQAGNQGASYGLSSLTNGFTSNTVGYRTPVWAGLSANASAYVSDNAEPNDKHDYGMGVGYRNEELGLEAGVQGLIVTGTGVVSGAPGQANAGRVHASFAQPAWAMGLSMEVVDVDAELDPRKYALLGASWQAFPSIRIAAAVGTVQDSDSAAVNNDGVGANLGMFWDVTRNLGAHVAVSAVEFDDVNNQTFSGVLGVRFVFDVDL